MEKEGLPDENELDVRGQLIINIIDYMKIRRGMKGIVELHSRVSERMGENIGITDILPREWYPHKLFRLFVEEGAKTVGKDLGTFAARVGKFAAENLGIMKFFIKISKPERMAKIAEDGWKKYHKKGRLEVTDFKEGYAVLRLSDYFYGPYVCEGLRANLQRYLEYTSKEVEVEETKCRSRGDPYCEFTIRWK